jgi:hypothetical protein
MAHNITITSDGVTIYLSGAGEQYSGSGTPWTAQATSPIEIAMNDLSGSRWTPQAPEIEAIYGGGPPFRYGQAPRYFGIGNVTETIPVQLRATSYDNACALLELLRRHLNTALYSAPCVLAIDPENATNPLYTEISFAKVQEDPRFLNEEKGLHVIRALITWTRRGFFTPASKTSIFSATTFTNTGTGANNNTQSMGTIVGDYRYLGQPMRLYLTGGDLSSLTACARKIYMSTVKSRSYTERSDAISTSSTSGVQVGSGITVTNQNDAGIKVRILARMDSMASNLELQARVFHGSNVPIFTSKWIDRDTFSSPFLDFGGFEIPWGTKQYNASIASSDLSIQILARSSDGIGATGTLDYVETLFYYTFGSIEYDSTETLQSGSSLAFSTVEIEAGAGMVRTITPPLAIWVSTSNGKIQENLILKGQVPKAIKGASLYLSWIADSLGHDETDTIQVTAEYAPMYHTLRGA